MASSAEARTVPAIEDDSVERRTREIGRDLFRRIGRGPMPWRLSWWHDRLMALTMASPEVKVQLFRFIDALPGLKSAESVRRHLDEYLDEAGDLVPSWMSAPLSVIPRTSWGDRFLAFSARQVAGQMAHRFIAGSDPDEALETVLNLRRQHLAFTADLLGEAVISEHEADAYQRTCLELLEGMAAKLAAQPEDPQIDRDSEGPIPRLNLSLKLTSLTARFDPLFAEATTERVLERLRPILRTARRLGAFVNVDMEQFAYRDLTYDIFRQVLLEDEFRDWNDAGIVVQAYQPGAEGDLEMLLRFVAERGTPITIRLVKGAYWDYEVIHAREMGWPVPLYTRKWESDANYERCARILMEHYREIRPALGSHNLRSLAKGIALAEALGVPQDGYEIQVLHGMGEPIAHAMAGLGRRVRVYTPYGAMLPGMAYLVRRLLENTSNESFLKAGFTDRAAIEELLRNPEELGAMWGRDRRKSQGRNGTNGQELLDSLPPFRNEPFTDFSRPQEREAFRKALETVRNQLGRTYDEPNVEKGEPLVSTDPGQTSRVIGRFPLCGPEEARRAVDTAVAAFPAWSKTSVETRAKVLIRAAEIMRSSRHELSAWEVFECGKPWREADGDIAEAIDFCEFYARSMLELSRPRHRDVPGETNVSTRFPRGVAVVIPPWNFPLAIPMGMTVAALVAGNATILKPSEQAPMMGWLLVRILRDAGLPREALQFVPGFGEAGKALVDDPRVAVIAFTGSMEVGLQINRNAAVTGPGQDHVKRVIAEMGGKNATIIDDDADLDEAVVGVLHSAFGYAGQKCSACSRVIVLEAVYDAFVARLAEAAHSVKVGLAEDPETVVGPVIDAEARARVERYRTLAETEGRVVARIEAGPLADHGNFIGPLIVADVQPTSPLAQEEIFGPVLAVLKARDLDHALEIANGTRFALTGGLYSRSPANIQEVKNRFVVGNLYVNRPITGALVDRQPFGGFKLSGIGTKAGGPDYLLEFLYSRTITENTLRRGFAPEPDGEEGIETETPEAVAETAASGL